MRLVFAIFLVCLLAFNITAYAHEIDLSGFDLSQLVKTYNDNLDKVPGFAKNIFGNERIDVYIDGEKFVGLVGQNGTIAEYKKSGVEKPTMKIYTTSETIGHLLENEKTLLDALKDKSIQYEGVGFVKKIKFGFIKIFQSIFLRD